MSTSTEMVTQNRAKQKPTNVHILMLILALLSSKLYLDKFPVLVRGD